MMRLVKILYGLLFCLKGMGQTTRLPLTHSYITAGAYSNHFTDAFSFTSNPACLGSLQELSGVGLLAERRWMLKELDLYELAATGILGKGGCGITLQRSGDADYSETGLELAYGKNLGRLELGIRFGYSRDQAAGYPGADFGSSGISIRFHVSEQLITGWELCVPVLSGAGKTNAEKGPQFFRMGLGYEWSPDLFLAFQVEKTSGMPVNVIPSLEYRYGEQFFFSFGVNSLTGSLYFKSGWKKNRLCIQLYTVYEPVPGFSPGMVLLWDRKNKKR
jgi:hypothetical protein